MLARGAVRAPARRGRAAPRRGSRSSDTAAACSARTGARGRRSSARSPSASTGSPPTSSSPMLRLPDHPLGMARFGAYSAHAGRRCSPDAGAPRRRGRCSPGSPPTAFRPFRRPDVLGDRGRARQRPRTGTAGRPRAGGSASISDAMISLLERARRLASRPASRVTSLDELGRRRHRDARPRSRRPPPTSPASGAAAASTAHCAATGTGRAASRSTSPSPRACRGPTSPRGRRAPSTPCGGFAEVAAAERMIDRGRMPERPFVLVGQQYVADPTPLARRRTPRLCVCPRARRAGPGDATEAIDRADRALRPRLPRADPRPATCATCAGMEAHNANYVGGDVVTGANTPRQLVARPRLALDPYWLGVDRRLPVLGRDPARRRCPRDVRLQRGHRVPCGGSSAG